MDTPNADDVERLVERLKEERHRLCLEVLATIFENRRLRQEIMQSYEQMVAQRVRLAETLQRTAHLLHVSEAARADGPLITDE